MKKVEPKGFLKHFYTSLVIWFLIWITKGWIFTAIIVIPLFNWARRRWKSKGVKR